MILLVVSIVLLSVSILVSRHYLFMKEWYLWACMLVETFMRSEAESRKLKVLREAGKKRFHITLQLLPQKIFVVFIHRIEEDLRAYDYTMKNYDRLVQGIALYDKNYLQVLELIDEESRKEKA